VFGWPTNSKKLEQFYPTALLETGYDIMFFWVFRMVGMCYAFSNKLPFNQIVFHGLIRDSKGRKMSKSLGNVIDPIDMIQGASLEELKSRILKSNLSEKEKIASVKTQEKIYPKGIEAIGSDAMRMACLTQDYKSSYSFNF
jgi:valyl-tRNA synthetase